MANGLHFVWRGYIFVWGNLSPQSHAWLRPWREIMLHDSCKYVVWSTHELPKKQDTILNISELDNGKPAKDLGFKGLLNVCPQLMSLPNQMKQICIYYKQ